MSIFHDRKDKVRVRDQKPKEVRIRTSSDDQRLDAVLALVRSGGHLVLSTRNSNQAFSPGMISDLVQAREDLSKALAELDRLLGALDFRMKNTP